MTLSGSLLVFVLVLLAYFGGYWALLHGFVLTQAWRWARGVDPDTRARGRVLVLVPSHHEGAALIDTVRTLLAQDYQGPVSVCVLVEDFSDRSVAALASAFEGRAEEDGGRTLLLHDAPGRQLRAVATGDRAKHHKLNFALARSTADYVALLDADHRAMPGWLSSALTTLEREGADAVQCRKGPLGTGHAAQAWDAVLSHTAFELFNLASWAALRRVNFTGSTAVFRAEALGRAPFAACITEDTWLSFALAAGGRRIAYDPRLGSVEETTPNLRSFVLRRRRWAAGHTHAFLAHARPLWRAELPGAARLQALILGQFYLVPAAVSGFFFAQGLYYFLQFTSWVRAAVLLGSAALASALTLYLSWRRGTTLRDTLVCWLAVAPHVSMAGAFLYLLYERETYYFLTSFPYQGQLWTAQGVLLGLGLLTVAVAWLRLRPTPLRDLAVFFITSPLVIFFDLLSTLLGLTDHLLGSSEWSRIDRTAQYSPATVGEALRVQFSFTRERKAGVSLPLWASALLAGAAGANELFSVGPCGEERALLWPPLLTARAAAPLLAVDVAKRVDGATVHADAVATVLPSAQPLTLRTFLDGALVDTVAVPAAGAAEAQHLRFSRPLGWATHQVRMVLSGAGVQCVVDRPVSTSVVEVQGGELVVNGEPFLVKGMVPTFSTPAIGLALSDGYRQLKRLGVNTLRLYHPPTPAILEAARANQLLVIAQPEQSTWDALDPTSAADRRAFGRRWGKLVESLDGFPYALLLNVGNELEINDRRPAVVAAISSLITGARQARHQVPTTYSTFAAFIDYPGEVQGINMLDSGETYWRDVVRTLPSRGRPFLASELGGFVAFYERPPTPVRQFRMLTQWRALLEARAVGAVFYSSHDNWAQAVPPGSFNDPWTADLPDDFRGYWDERNEPKPELATLGWMLSDVELEAVPPRVSASDALVAVRVRNRRPYALRGVTAAVAGRPWDVGALAPGEVRVVELPLEALRRAPGYPLLSVDLAWTSHAGLAGGGSAPLAVPDASSGPVPLTPHLGALERSARRLRGELLAGDAVELVVPEAWAEVSVNGAVVPNDAPRLRVPLPAPLHPVDDLQVSFDGRTYEPYGPRARDREGLVFLRFRLPDLRGGARQLVLQGLGATQAFVRWNDGTTAAYPAHPYRETLIDLGDRRGEMTVRLQRRALEYLRADASPSGEAILIHLREPVVFSPAPLDVQEAR